MNKLIAEQLLKIKAVYLRPDDPFTWASGIKSPIYCDNRIILAYPEAREIVESAIADMVKQKFPQAQQLMGTSTAGIAHAAISGYKLGIPVGYVRGSAKTHGRNNKIEGKLNKGDKVVVIEDLISTGGSCIDVVNTLRDAGADVLGVISIFTYNISKGFTNFADANCSYTPLCDLETLLEVAVNTNYITSEQAKGILEFRNSL